jgi:hypothetical protein
MSIMSSLLKILFLRTFADEPAPAGTPAPSPSPAASEDDFEGAEKNIDWGAISEGVPPGADDDEAEAQAAPAPAPAPSPTATPTPAPAPSPAPVEAKKTTTEEPAPAAPATQPAAQAPAPAQPLTPEQQADQDKQFKEWEQSEIGKMAQQYADSLSDDDVAALQTEPEKILPRMAAQIRMDTMKATLSAIGQLLPGLLSGHQQANQREQQAQDAFFSKNDDLRDVPMNKILEAGRAYRQMNPEVKDPEEVIEGIGNMVRAVLKRQAKQAASAEAEGKGKPGPKKGYQPAGTGASTKKEAPAQTDQSIWSELADDD